MTAVLVCAAGRSAALPADSVCMGGWLRMHGTDVVTRTEMLTVVPGAGLARAGVQPGDAIIACDAAVLTGVAPDVVHAILAASATNAHVTLFVQHGTNAARRVSVTNTAYYPLHNVAAPRASRIDARVADELARVPAMQPCAHIVTNRCTDALRRRADPWHHWLCDAALQQPQHMAAFAGRMGRAALRAARRGDWQHAITGVPHPAVDATDVTSALACAELHVRRAFTAFSSQEISRIITQAPVIAEQLDRHFYLHDDPDRARYLDSWRVIASAQRIDHDELRAACAWLCAAAQIAVTQDWRAWPVDPALRVAGCSGGLRAAFSTAFGMVVIGGDGPNTYDPGPAIIIDTGGDDVYRNRRAALPERGISLVVDLAGDDEYTATGALAVAAGITGVDLIVDAEGNDYYSCPLLGSGAGIFGIGAIVNLAGNDRYIGERAVQGIGMFGAGALIDLDGDDAYLALRFAQAVGLPGGEGRICDAAGNDIYIALLGTPSVYGTPGVYNSFSQGAGIGFRLIAAGGVGLLVDGSGNDRYESGEFAQGVGYYLGAGVLYDAAGNDHYRATRYCQATAAHTAVGMLVDLSGDDRYDGRVTAVQGVAWDTSAACLRDYAGNDQYHSAGLALGTACIGSYAEFVDVAGDDTYRYQPGQALGCSWLQPGETNCAVCIDAAGNDRYDASLAPAARSNDVRCITGACGLFIDASSAP